MFVLKMIKEAALEVLPLFFGRGVGGGVLLVGVDDFCYQFVSYDVAVVELDYGYVVDIA